MATKRANGRVWPNLGRRRPKEVDDDVHCAPKTHTLSSSQHTGEASTSECHSEDTPQQPRQRLQEGKRRCCAAAARSNKADLGFPLASRGRTVKPKNTPPRRKWHPQASPWSAPEARSRVFTRARDLPRRTETSGRLRHGLPPKEATQSPVKEDVAHHRSSSLARQVRDRGGHDQAEQDHCHHRSKNSGHLRPWRGSVGRLASPRNQAARG